MTAPRFARYELIRSYNDGNKAWFLLTEPLLFCLFVYWGFRARRLLGSLCAHNVRYARELGSKINEEIHSLGDITRRVNNLDLDFADKDTGPSPAGKTVPHDVRTH